MLFLKPPGLVIESHLIPKLRKSSKCPESCFLALYYYTTPNLSIENTNLSPKSTWIPPKTLHSYTAIITLKADNFVIATFLYINRVPLTKSCKTNFPEIFNFLHDQDQSAQIRVDSNLSSRFPTSAEILQGSSYFFMAQNKEDTEWLKSQT